MARTSIVPFNCVPLHSFLIKTCDVVGVNHRVDVMGIPQTAYESRLAEWSAPHAFNHSMLFYS
ncbi:hypothetical protein B0H10DRAFT_2026839 [Mycena sp. CBHHK59/15]|nr:hypothetical protein B0H10DRAFT_2026839 [Mycena sp. CBHHK59/15]